MPEEPEPARPRTVLDSNVVISGLAFSGGKPRQILDLLRAGEIHAWISPFMLGEISRSLDEDFGWSQTAIEEALAALTSLVTVIDAREETTIVQADPADNRVLDCALQGNVQYLVTGDRRHLLPLREFQGIKIVSPAEFLASLTETE